MTGLSIGYRARKSHQDEGSGARVLTSVDLVEVSMVTFPANSYARVRRVKSLPLRTPIIKDIRTLIRVIEDATP